MCIAAGILGIVGGGITVAAGAGADIGFLGISELDGGLVIAAGVVSVILGVIAILGGRYALRREKFWWAMGGAICAALSATSWLFIAVGLAAIILIGLSRKEFAA